MEPNDEIKSLSEALDMLDPDDPAHWTKKGEPNLNVIKELTGEQFNREQATEAAPDLTRESAALAKAAGVSGVDAGDPRVDPDGNLVTGKIPTQNPEQVDFVSILDACQAAMTNNIRIYGEALYRVMQYYKAERETIVRQLENATARGKIKVVGPTMPVTAMSDVVAAVSEGDPDNGDDDDDENSD